MKKNTLLYLAVGGLLLLAFKKKPVTKKRGSVMIPDIEVQTKEQFEADRKDKSGGVTHLANLIKKTLNIVETKKKAKQKVQTVSLPKPILSMPKKVKPLSFNI